MVDVLNQGMIVWRISDDTIFLDQYMCPGPLLLGMLQMLGDLVCHVGLILHFLLMLHLPECLHVNEGFVFGIDSCLVLLDHMVGELFIVDVGFTKANIAVVAFGNHHR